MMGHKVSPIGLRLGVLKVSYGDVDRLQNHDSSLDLIGWSSAGLRHEGHPAAGPGYGNTSYHLRYVRTAVDDGLLSAGYLVNRCRVEADVSEIRVYTDYYCMVQNNSMTASKSWDGEGSPDPLSLPYLPNGRLSDLAGHEWSLHHRNYQSGGRTIIFLWKEVLPDASLILKLMKRSRRFTFKNSVDFVRVASTMGYMATASVFVRLIAISLAGSKRQSRDLKGMDGLLRSIVAFCPMVTGMRMQVHGPLDGKDRSQYIQYVAGHAPISNPASPVDFAAKTIVGADCVIGIKLSVHYL